MSKPLTEKQRRFIQAHHPELPSSEMAKRLGVEKNLIDRYLAENVLSGKKKNIFTVMLLLLPLAALMVLETLLRIFSYGPNLDLIVIKEKAGQKYYALNPEVGQRYFTQGIAAVPQLYEETFAYHKPQNGYRIFCLGESTTASFPYELNARFHRLLQDRLTTLFPGKTIEVINVGLSAVNSFSVREFAEELIDYQPDLFLLYLGHNEFYGAFGVGSTQYLGKSRTVIRFYLWLQKFKIFQLLRNTITAFKGNTGKSSVAAPTQTLMEQVVGNQYLAFGSADYQKAAQSFRENLTDIIKIAQNNNIGILVSTLTSNLKDHPPFHSLFSAQLPSEAKTQWEKNFQHGVEWEKQKAYAPALTAYREAEKLDAAPAKLHFQIGKCYEALQRYPEALAAYQQARDADALRFRAAGEFNEIIRQVCRNVKAPIVEMEKSFADHSPNGITGAELICEHLHPNFAGYFLMAKTFCTAMAENHFIARAADWNRQLDKSDEEYKHVAAVTEFDLSIGAYKIERLTSHWPFAAPIIMNIPMPDETLTRKLRQLAITYSQGQISWNEAHYQLASDFAARKLYDRAEQEYHAVLKIIPENYYPYFKIGDLYLTQEKFAPAEMWLNQALQRHPRSPYVYAKLATVHFHTRAYEKAVANFAAALNLNKVSREFSPAEIAWAEYYTAVAQLQLGHRAESLRALDEVIRLQPDNAQAQQLRALLQSNAPVQLQLTP